MSLGDEIVQEYKQALNKSIEAKEDLELDCALKDKKIEDLIDSLNDLKNERDCFQHDSSIKDDKMKELEMALQAKESEERVDTCSVDAGLKNENDQLKKRLGELLMQAECAKMNISYIGVK